MTSLGLKEAFISSKILDLLEIWDLLAFWVLFIEGKSSENEKES
jgi:hypothetical protein